MSHWFRKYCVQHFVMREIICKQSPHPIKHFPRKTNPKKILFECKFFSNLECVLNLNVNFIFSFRFQFFFISNKRPKKKNVREKSILDYKFHTHKLKQKEFFCRNENIFLFKMLCNYINYLQMCIIYWEFSFSFLFACCRCEVNYNYGRKFSLRFSLCLLKSFFCVQLNDLVLFWFIGALTHYVTRESFIDVISTV